MATDHPLVAVELLFLITIFNWPPLPHSLTTVTVAVTPEPVDCEGDGDTTCDGDTEGDTTCEGDNEGDDDTTCDGDTEGEVDTVVDTVVPETYCFNHCMAGRSVAPISP